MSGPRCLFYTVLATRLQCSSSLTQKIGKAGELTPQSSCGHRQFAVGADLIVMKLNEAQGHLPRMFLDALETRSSVIVKACPGKELSKIKLGVPFSATPRQAVPAHNWTRVEALIGQASHQRKACATSTLLSLSLLVKSAKRNPWSSQNVSICTPRLPSSYVPVCAAVDKASALPQLEALARL